MSALLGDFPRQDGLVGAYREGRQGLRSRPRHRFSPTLVDQVRLEQRCLLTSNVSLAVQLVGKPLVGPVRKTPAPAQIQETVSDRFLDPQDGVTKIDMTLKNIMKGKDSIPGPVQVLFEDLPEGVTLENADGKTSSGVPYIDFGVINKNKSDTEEIDFRGLATQPINPHITAAVTPPKPQDESSSPPPGNALAGINQDTFFQQYANKFGKPLTDDQQEALGDLLTMIVNDPGITDVRWAAYMLATVKAEHSDFLPGPETESL